MRRACPARSSSSKGGAFLAGRQLLKGGGAITDFESQKAEAAFARLNQAQSPKDFKAALDDFNSAVQEGVRKLEQQAGAAPSQPGLAAMMFLKASTLLSGPS